ncbi:conserved Plasmodium protein, unknown function [Plasmodium gallinaceum]|uniref:Uncharacterized protein n=1 Tax=Plasmodium gallinaceum TaxID=5849 RepID=A0A1J1GYS6_PLAGA|nr:conserved Plasmodium protein, unknown function [Plasmodium gallinaceum]CRG97608.1 conserved Plasmodium protein, unknown function [Plasmodium gallinaceum]
MVDPKVEVAFLIYNFEFNKLRIYEKSEIIIELNRKINKYGILALQSSYKYVNNFSYTTEIFHYFFKLAEYYLFKYFNSIIVDSIFFFKCINDIKSNSSYDIQKKEKENQVHFNHNADVKKNENVNDFENIKKSDDDYSFDCRTLHIFIENLKRIDRKNNKKDVSRYNNNNKNININNESNIKKINMQKENKNNEEISSSGNLKFRKTFLYELCEISNFYNKKNIMIIITKIFRKIINRNKIRYFICENDKIKKKNYLKFFLNLFLGIFIYIYIFKYIKENYKSIEYFIFLNNLKNIRQVYFNNVPYLEENQIISFIKYIKFINIRMFQYIYISFFINIYKYVNLIYNLTILSFFNFFKYLYEKNKKELHNIKNESPKIKYKLKNTNMINDEKSKKINNINNEDENIIHYDRPLSENIKIEENESFKDENKEYTKKKTYEDTNNITRSYLDKYSIGKKENGEQNISYMFIKNDNFKLCNSRKDIPLKLNSSYSLDEKEEYINELVYDCYVYIFIFFKYIKIVRKKMKLKIMKIQKHIKNMIGIFVKIYNFNKVKGKGRKNSFDINMEKKEDNFNAFPNKDSFDNYVDDTFHFLYFKYIELSRSYKICIKLNYKIIKLVHMFHLLLKHFYKFFPVLNIKKESCIIYNYYNKSFIYNEKKKKKDNKENLNEKKENHKEKDNFDVFKNVTAYQLEFFYFIEKKNNEKEIIHDLVEDNETESFNHIFNKNLEKFSSFIELNQFKGEEEDYLEKVLSKKISHNSKKLFLYCLNRNLDNFLINVNKDKISFDDDIVEYQDINKGNKNENCVSNISKRENISIEKEKNVLKTKNVNKILCLYDSPILEALKNNKNIYNIIVEIIENFCNKKFTFLENCIADLNMYNKNALEIYEDNIFDMHYKFKKEVPFESDESLKNKKLLEVKIFLDYEKIYTKKTVETQTQISLFKKDMSIQMSKDKEVFTTTEQFIQTKEISNPIFYLKDIYN